MNIMYVASRYHTNQIPIIKGWLKNGDNVMFVCQFRMKSENYDVLQPVVLGYSAIFKLVLKVYQTICAKKISKAGIPMYFNAQFGFPPMRKVKKQIREFQPDVIIYRDRCVYNAFIYQYSKKKVKGILYNQTPYWEKQDEKINILHRIIRGLCPQVRMTPVLGTEDQNTVNRAGVYYVPFVIEPHIASFHEKQYFREGKIHILCVGKFEKRKHHIELLETILKLPQREEIEITFIGECSRTLHEEYLAQLQNCVEKQGFEKQTRILVNLSLNEVYEEYMKADLFVLPSTGEFASISQLEAMSCAVPVICSDTNGTADCVENGRNGMTFHDKDFADLYKKLELILSDKERIIEMGQESYKIVLEKYQFTDYQKSIRRMMKEI